MSSYGYYSTFDKFMEHTYETISDRTSGVQKWDSHFAEENGDYAYVLFERKKSARKYYHNAPQIICTKRMTGPSHYRLTDREKKNKNEDRKSTNKSKEPSLHGFFNLGNALNVFMDTAVDRIADACLYVDNTSENVDHSILSHLIVRPDALKEVRLTPSENVDHSILSHLIVRPDALKEVRLTPDDTQCKYNVHDVKPNCHALNCVMSRSPNLREASLKKIKSRAHDISLSRSIYGFYHKTIRNLKCSCQALLNPAKRETSISPDLSGLSSDSIWNLRSSRQKSNILRMSTLCGSEPKNVGRLEQKSHSVHWINDIMKIDQDEDGKEEDL